MKKWELKYHFQDTKENSIISSISYSQTNDLIVAGTSKGDLLFFERCVDGTWSNIESSTIKGTDQKFDFFSQCFADPTIIDLDFVPIQRKCPMLLTASEKQIKLWFISNHLEPIAPPDFTPKGLQFPTVFQSERLLTPNQVTSFESDYGESFNSLRCCPDGINFAYCQDKTISVRYVDRIDPALTVFLSTTKLTKIDYSPKEYEILLAGDYVGRANIIDMRSQPVLKTPSLCATSASIIGPKRFYYVNDCGFSPDGTKFFTRHYSDLLFWDLRHTVSCVNRVKLKHESESNDATISKDGRDIFRSVWVDPQTVATGSFGSALFMVKTDGKILTKYNNPKEQKESKILLTQKSRMSFAKEHQVSAIAINQGLNRIIASNSGSLQIFDLTAF